MSIAAITIELVTNSLIFSRLTTFLTMSIAKLIAILGIKLYTTLLGDTFVIANIALFRPNYIARSILFYRSRFSRPLIK